MKICDCCNKQVEDHHINVVPLADMKKAVLSNWRGAVDAREPADDLTSEIEALFNSALSPGEREISNELLACVLRDKSDWGLCGGCHEKLSYHQSQSSSSPLWLMSTTSGGDAAFKAALGLYG